MRFKKGFTLAEILIVLMVIGALATMTIPSLIKGVSEAQYKTAYKKAFNALTNIGATERIAGTLPSASSQAEVFQMFKILNSSLSARDYAANTVANEGAKAAASDYIPQIIYSGTAGADQILYNGNADRSPWIVTDDNLAYFVYTDTNSGTTCGTKADINKEATYAKMAKAACVMIAVDVNGLSNVPNKFDTYAKKELASTDATPSLDGDRFIFFVGNDGITAGNKQYTLGGRLVGDLK